MSASRGSGGEGSGAPILTANGLIVRHHTYLVALTNAPHALKALDFVVQIVNPAWDRVLLVSVLKNKAISKEQARDEYRFLKTHAAALADMGIATKVYVKKGRPGPTLVQMAGVFSADAIVMGARGVSRLTRFVLGSVSSYVAESAPCSVYVVKDEGDTPIPPLATDAHTRARVLVQRAAEAYGEAAEAAEENESDGELERAHEFRLQGTSEGRKFICAIDKSRYSNEAFKTLITSMARPGDSIHAFFVHQPTNARAKAAKAITASGKHYSKPQLQAAIEAHVQRNYNLICARLNTYAGIAEAYSVSFSQAIVENEDDVRQVISQYVSEIVDHDLFVLGNRGLTKDSVGLYALTHVKANAVLIVREKALPSEYLAPDQLKAVQAARKERIRKLNELLQAEQQRNGDVSHHRRHRRRRHRRHKQGKRRRRRRRKHKRKHHHHDHSGNGNGNSSGSGGRKEEEGEEERHVAFALPDDVPADHGRKLASPPPSASAYSIYSVYSDDDDNDGSNDAEEAASSKASRAENEGSESDSFPSWSSEELEAFGGHLPNPGKTPSTAELNALAMAASGKVVAAANGSEYGEYSDGDGEEAEEEEAGSISWSSGDLSTVSLEDDEDADELHKFMAGMGYLKGHTPSDSAIELSTPTSSHQAHSLGFPNVGGGSGEYDYSGDE